MSDKLTEDEVTSLALCRRSLIEHEWHKRFGDASGSLMNFNSFDEFLVYAGIFFPELRPDIRLLKKRGAEYFVKKKRLRPLEQCLLCRVLPKIGLTDMQIGFIWGRSRSCIHRLKNWWLPKWGYAGKTITDLELYEDYVNLERPEAYYDNHLGDVGCQCDGKDFYTESVRKNSALNRGQRSNKLKAAALRCITWSSLTGLVWAFTPVVLSRVSKNALVH